MNNNNSILKKYYLNEIILISILIVSWILIYLPNLGTIPLSSAEANRLSVSFSMDNISGLFKADMIGQFYSHKPPVFSFIVYLFLNIISGSIEFVSRFPSALSVLVISIISFIRLKWLDKLSTFFVSLLIIISPFSLYYGRIVEMDMIFAGLIYLSLVELISFYENQNNKLNLFICGLLQGLAILVKGPFGLVMMIGVILFRSNSSQEIIKVLIINFSIIFLITFTYFGITLLNGYLSFENLLDEVLTRFKSPLGFSRVIGERLMSIFYAMPVIAILISKNKFYKKNILSFIINLNLVLLLLLFMLPGYQADYGFPLFFFSCIPAGYILSNWVKLANFKKLISIFSYFTIFIILYIFILPSYINQSINGNNTFNLLRESVKQERTTNKQTNILLTESGKILAPYFYSADKNYNISMIYDNNLNEEKSFLSNEYFIFSNFNLSKTKSMLKIDEKNCMNLEKIVSSKFRGQFFEWPYDGKNNFLSLKENMNLYKVLKCD